MLQTTLISSLAKVFPDEIQGLEFTNAAALRNEPFSFQIAYRASGRRGMPIYTKIESDLDEDLIFCYKVGFVPVTNGYWRDTDAYYSRTTPGMYPDPLLKRNTNSEVEQDPSWLNCRFEIGEKNLLTASASVYQSLWITVNEDSKVIPAGEHWIKVTFYNGMDGKEVACQTFRLTVIDALLPKQEVDYTTWLHCDCLAEMYQVEMFSDRHFEILASFVEAAGKNGITMLLLPAFTPPLDTRVNKERMTAQLVGVEVTEEGYRFDFSLMKRFIEMCRANGVYRFEHSHLFTQWGAKHAPKIMATVNGEYKQIFGWDTDSLDPAYGAFLTAYLKELKIFLEEMKIGKNDILFHVSDEPEEAHLEYYKNALNVIRPQIEGYRCGDALSRYDFYEAGYVETPIVAQYSEDIDLYIKNSDNYWAYYTSGHSPEGYSNRLITTTSARNRIMGVQMYYNNAKGFLHWGYNYYYGDLSYGLFNPFNNPCGYGQAPGIGYVVYPAADGTAVMSLRMKVQNEGFIDYRALQVLEGYIGREAVLAFLREQVGPINYEDIWDEKTMLDLRKAINAKIAECAK